MSIEFRLLDKEDIDVRVGGVYDSGITLLLYKNARVDMAVLDKAVGPYNWQRDHKEIKGVVYCGVGIFNPVDAKDGRDPWIWKWDAGSESNTEKEKGEASDSFKRACVNWGIGRELYTAPLIWIPAGKVKIEGKKVKDRFKVRLIEYKDGVISCLAIENKKGEVVYSYGSPA